MTSNGKKLIKTQSDKDVWGSVVCWVPTFTAQNIKDGFGLDRQ